MAATNLLPTAAEGRSAWRHLGLECSGIVRAVGEGVSSVKLGEQVVALGSDCLASHVVVPADLAIPLPHDMNFQLGASIPTAYATARYSLVTLARVSAGEQVLIHAATGGVGLAAISIARSLGANVIATAGNEEKRAYLRKLGVKHVFDSRTLAFVDEVRTATDGRGVDVVLNSLSGPFLESSLSLLAFGGRFVEIGKRDIYTNTEIGLRALRHNIAFFVVDLARIAVERPDLLRSELQAVFDDLSAGRTAPLPVRTFPVGSVADAFSHMARANHIGKIVISFDEPSATVEQCDDSAAIIDPGATYLITGGTRGLGLAIGSWLVRQGACSLVLVGRSPPHQPEAAQIEALRTAGASITVVSADIGSIEGARRAVQAARSTGKPLRGVFHAAGLVDSAMVKDLDREQVRRVFAGKVLGAWHLHELTSELPLDYFVCCSSAAAVLGPIGQAHYAGANRALDALAALRRMSGLPGLSINFGPIADAGYLVSRPEVANYLTASGVLSMQAETALDVLGTILHRDPVTVMCADINWSRLSLALSSIGSAPRTAAMARSRATNGGARGLLAAASPEERTGMVADYLRERVGAVLNIAPESVEIDRPLSEFGLDSLTLFELKARVEEEIGVVIPIGKFLQRPTINHIGTEINERLQAVCVREDHIDRPPLHAIGADAA